MNMPLSRLILVLTAGTGIVCGLFIGAVLERRFSVTWRHVELSSVQAMLAFNHLLSDRKLKLLLAKGCASAAAVTVDIAEDKETELIAGLYIDGKINSTAIKYMLVRDPNILEELKGFKSKYGPSWSVPECMT